ncbi:hypothetical protein PCK2_000455 [Pneumocystis canis]|nr:hypothetical protein PCK2_000455 [Pneumocystis canis]
MVQKFKYAKAIQKKSLSENYPGCILSDLSLGIDEKDEEEKTLEAKVFGDINPFNEELKDSLLKTYDLDSSRSFDNGIVDFSLLQDHELFYVDTCTKKEKNGDCLVDKSVSDAHKEKFAWDDSDDERLVISLASVKRLRKLRKSEEDDVINGKEYSMRLRKQLFIFERINPVPDWAVLFKFSNDQNLEQNKYNGDKISEDSDSADDIAISIRSLKSLLMSSEGYARKTLSSALSPTTINIKRLRDANSCSPSESAILSLSFHPLYPLLLSGGHDRILRIFHIDGDVNSLVSSLYLPSSSIQTAVFHPRDNKIIVGGRRKYFYIWDLESGNFGKVSRTYGHDDTQTTMENLSLSPCGRFIARKIYNS